ncbi:zinc finger protein ZF(C2H2)-124 [Ciona intestinalis]
MPIGLLSRLGNCFIGRNILSSTSKVTNCRQKLFNQTSCIVFVTPKYSTLCKLDYEKYSDATLESLSDFFDEISDSDFVSNEFDAFLESGVLTVRVSKAVGTYVINKQTPNKQIWLSSPISGPKRYDFEDNSWKYLHNGGYLHHLIEDELKEIVSESVDLSSLPFYKERLNK